MTWLQTPAPNPPSPQEARPDRTETEVSRFIADMRSRTLSWEQRDRLFAAINCMTKPDPNA